MEGKERRVKKKERGGGGGGGTHTLSCLLGSHPGGSTTGGGGGGGKGEYSVIPAWNPQFKFEVCRALQEKQRVQDEPVLWGKQCC